MRTTGRWTPSVPPLQNCVQIHLPHATFSYAQSLHSTDDKCACLKFELRSQSTHIIHALMGHPLLHETLSTSSLSVCLFCPSCVVFVCLSDSRPVVHASINPLRRSTAGWQFCGKPTSHKNKEGRKFNEEEALKQAIVILASATVQNGAALAQPPPRCGYGEI